MRKFDHPWYRPRGYLHFDQPISKEKAEGRVTNPHFVSTHSFYPFIRYEIQTVKIAKDKNTGKLARKPKERPVSYASHIDSQIYSYYSYILNPLYEEILLKENLGPSVLAFRKFGKNNIDFAKQAFGYIAERGECVAIAYDVEKFFNNLDHQILKRAWCRLLSADILPEDHYKVFKSVTKFAYVLRDDLYQHFSISKHNQRHKKNRICKPAEFRDRVRKTGLLQINRDTKGIPQGSPISALLSNIYMLEFDTRIGEYLKDIGGYYLRYCDDILCVIPPEYKSTCDSIIQTEINNLKLEINKQKTKQSHYYKTSSGLKCDKPLQYLGFMFDGQAITIRSAALSRFSERMKRGVRLAKLTMIKYNKIRVARGQPVQSLYKKKLYKKYSHLGRRNFVVYGKRAAKIMDSKAIRAGSSNRSGRGCSMKLQRIYSGSVLQTEDLLEANLKT